MPTDDTAGESSDTASIENNRCPQCGGAYQRLAGHWAKSSECDFPKLQQKHRQTLAGILLSGGGIRNRAHNPHAQISSTNLEVLNWIRGIWGVLSRDVSEVVTEREAQERMVGPHERAGSGRSAIHRFETRTSPRLSSWCHNWYCSNGEKQAPADLTLTPAVLKTVWCLKGSFTGNPDRTSYPRIAITRSPCRPSRWADVLRQFDPQIDRQKESVSIWFRKNARFVEELSKKGALGVGYPAVAPKIPGGRVTP